MAAWALWQKNWPQDELESPASDAFHSPIKGNFIVQDYAKHLKVLDSGLLLKIESQEITSLCYPEIQAILIGSCGQRSNVLKRFVLVLIMIEIVRCDIDPV